MDKTQSAWIFLRDTAATVLKCCDELRRSDNLSQKMS